MKSKETKIDKLVLKTQSLIGLLLKLQLAH